MDDYYTGDRSIECLDREIRSLKDQLQSYRSKVNRAYLLAEKLDEEALDGVWTETKNAKMGCAGRIRIALEG